MKNNTALCVKVNQDIYNNVISFIMNSCNDVSDTIILNPMYNQSLIRELNITEMYGSRYVGELYERFEEKGITDIRDIRALALALADMSEIQGIGELFVGSQRMDFIKKIKSLYDEKFDVYLGVALSKLLDPPAGIVVCNELLKESYSETEDVIFAALTATIKEPEEVFEKLREQLVNLLGINRTVPVVGNEKLYGTFISLFYDILKNYRKKSSQLLKTLCVMAEKRIRENTAQYKLLNRNGYTNKDILHLNYFMCSNILSSSLLQSLSQDNVLWNKTITYQKLAVDYCKCLLSSKEKITDTEKEVFLNLLTKYKKFDIKCNGQENISHCFDDTIIGNNDTFIWFLNIDTNLRPKEHSNVFRFDILGEISEGIIKNLDYKHKYTFLNIALSNLTPNDKVLGEKYIAKFEKHDDFNYLKSFNKGNNDFNAFSMTVNMGIEDILKYIDNLENLSVSLKKLLSVYVNGIRSITAYNFIKKFAEKYGIMKIKEILCINFYNGFLKRNNFYFYSDELDISRDFLTREQNRQVFGWIIEYIFYESQRDYPTFMYRMLIYKRISEYFTKEELHNLFIISKEALKRTYKSAYIKELYSMYLTEDELDEVRKEEYEAENKRLENEMSELFIENIIKFRALFDSSFKSINNFVGNWIFEKEKNVVYGIALSVSEKMLEITEYLEDSEAKALYEIYLKALKNEIIDCKSFCFMIKQSEEKLEMQQSNLLQPILI